jgi:hypothetical protein
MHQLALSRFLQKHQPILEGQPAGDCAASSAIGGPGRDFMSLRI